MREEWRDPLAPPSLGCPLQGCLQHVGPALGFRPEAPVCPCGFEEGWDGGWAFLLSPISDYWSNLPVQGGTHEKASQPDPHSILNWWSWEDPRGCTRAPALGLFPSELLGKGSQSRAHMTGPGVAVTWAEGYRCGRPRPPVLVLC